MSHSNIDISKLRLYNRDGRQVDLVETTDDAGNTYLSGRIFFNPLSVALYDNQNFYLLNKTDAYEQYAGSIQSSTDVYYRDFIGGVQFPNNLQLGDIIEELPSTSQPTAHIDYNSNPNGIAWSPVYISDMDPETNRIKMSKPALHAGDVEFKTIKNQYVFPGENVGDKFSFAWSKRDSGIMLQGWPHLNDEAHVVGDYRIYKGRLYKCTVSYVGPYVGNAAMWAEVSINKDEYGFFIYDVLIDQQKSPYIEKVLSKTVTYSSDQVGLRYPMEFNVAFNPTDEIAYDNVLTIYYTYADTGEKVKIIELSFYGEGVVEDERFTTWLANFGIKFNKYDAMILKDYDLEEALPDWTVVNSAMKQMFFNKEEVFPYIGTYRGLTNMISLLGFANILKVKEYWLNQNPKSVYFNRMLLVDISDMMDNGKIETMNVVEFNRVVKFDDAMRKTGFLALSYEFTKESGEYDEHGIPIVVETSDMVPSEVFYKLNKMKNKLKNEFLPTNVLIKDIIGEFVYFQRVVPRTWSDQTKIYNSEVGEDATIGLFPDDNLHVQNVESLYTKKYKDGVEFPLYTFNTNGADPYESGQRYSTSRIPGLIDAINQYYSETIIRDLNETSRDYYWEFGDTPDTPIGCPIVLTFNVNKLTIGDLNGRKLSDFSFGTDGYSQNYFSSVEHPRIASPLSTQWSEITILEPVVYGHIYTHNISVNGYTYQNHYTSGITVNVIADELETSLTVTDQETSTTFTFQYASEVPASDISMHLVSLINASGRPLVAVDNLDGTFRIMSSTTDPFTATPLSNCEIIGDTVDDIANGLVDSILSNGSPLVIDAWVESPGTGKYFIRAVNYEDQYVNMFDSAASYHTLDNIDYLNMYEIEWKIVKTGSGLPYSFAWRGLLKDLRVMPHVLPYAGKYDISVMVYDFSGSATMVYEPKLVEVFDVIPEITALEKLEDKFNYQMSNLYDVMLQDLGNSQVYNPNILMRDTAGEIGNLQINALDWDFYRRSMYTYNINTDSGAMLWDTSLPEPEYVPWYACNHPKKYQWGTDEKFRLTSMDFQNTRIGDLYYLKLKDTVYNSDFLAGFHMWNPAPFDKIIFGRTIGSPSLDKIEYVCPQIIHADVATISNIDLSNVNTIDDVLIGTGDIVLVGMQSDTSENGVYVAQSMGVYCSLTRLPECDTAYKSANSFVVVLSGTYNTDTSWRTINYNTTEVDTFSTSPMEYYQCAYSNNYVIGTEYMISLSDIIMTEQHPIVRLFSSHVILYGVSPEIQVLHITARNFDKFAYQYLSYYKNYDTSLYAVIPTDVITGSEYTFGEPIWAYSDTLMLSLEQEYSSFKREELFLFAPIMDILNGLTNNSDYFINNNYMEISDGTQVGHLPTVFDENYFGFTKTKAFNEGFFIPMHGIVFFTVNNIFAKRQFVWTLFNDVTGEEVVRVTGVPFFVWKFADVGMFRLTVVVHDKYGNIYNADMTSFIHVHNKLDYGIANDTYNTRRYNEIKKQGVMYGVQ